MSWVLNEQDSHWRRRYRWEFESSRTIIQRLLDSRRLHGYLLLAGSRAIGYCYFIPEDGKALVGDLFLADAYRDAAAEKALLEPTLRAAALYPGVRRLEGQLLSLSSELTPQDLFSRALRLYSRLYMVREGLTVVDPPPPERSGMRIRPWAGDYLDATAELIAVAYQGHADSNINDQYRTLGGARRFLLNTTQHTGCGTFLPQASFAAWPKKRVRLSGVCLASRIAERSGHITQLCVAAADRDKGLGRELLGRSLRALRALGCDSVTLTVTADNAAAIRLYESFGFTIWRRFSAFVWEAD